MSAAASTHMNFVSKKSQFEPKIESLNLLGVASASVYASQKSPVQIAHEKYSKLAKKRNLESLGTSCDVVDGLKIKRSTSVNATKFDDESDSDCSEEPVFDCSEDREVYDRKETQRTPVSALGHYIEDVFINNFEEASSPSSTSSSSSFVEIHEEIIEPCKVTLEESAASFTSPITSSDHSLEPQRYRDSYLLVFVYASSSTARGWKLDANHYVFEFDISGTPYYVTAPENGTGLLTLETNDVAPAQIVDFSTDRRVFKQAVVSATGNNGLQLASNANYWIDYSTVSKRFAKVAEVAQENVKDITFEGT